MTTVYVSEQDVQSLAEKLAAFTRTLSPGELAAFELLEEQLLQAVIADEPEVQGFDFGRLDMLAGDARRQDLLRESAQAQAPAADRMRFWQSVLASISGNRRG